MLKYDPAIDLSPRQAGYRFAILDSGGSTGCAFFPGSASAVSFNPKACLEIIYQRNSRDFICLVGIGRDLGIPFDQVAYFCSKVSYNPKR